MQPPEGGEEPARNDFKSLPGGIDRSACGILSRSASLAFYLLFQSLSGQFPTSGVLLFISVFGEDGREQDQTVMQWDLNLCSYMYSTLSGN